MTAQRSASTNPRLQSALDELRGIIQQRFPEATFEISRGVDDPRAVHLTATVDVEDTDDVVDLVIDRMMELQIDEGLPIFVIPVRPVERALEELRRTGSHAFRARGSSDRRAGQAGRGGGGPTT